MQLLVDEIKLSRVFCDDPTMEMDIWHTLDVLIAKGEVLLEKEKEEMCDFVEYCIQRHRDFIDGDLPSREYEGDTGEMFDWRYADKATKAKMTRERNKFWKEADEMRREREEKFNQESNGKLENL